MHVYAQNKYCNEWNDFMLETILEEATTCIAHDSKKDKIT